MEKLEGAVIGILTGTIISWGVIEFPYFTYPEHIHALAEQVIREKKDIQPALRLHEQFVQDKRPLAYQKEAKRRAIIEQDEYKEKKATYERVLNRWKEEQREKRIPYTIPILAFCAMAGGLYERYHQEPL